MECNYYFTSGERRFTFCDVLSPNAMCDEHSGKERGVTISELICQGYTRTDIEKEYKTLLQGVCSRCKCKISDAESSICNDCLNYIRGVCPSWVCDKCQRSSDPTKVMVFYAQGDDGELLHCSDCADLS